MKRGTTDDDGKGDRVTIPGQAPALLPNESLKPTAATLAGFTPVRSMATAIELCLIPTRSGPSDVCRTEVRVGPTSRPWTYLQRASMRPSASVAARVRGFNSAPRARVSSKRRALFDPIRSNACIARMCRTSSAE